VETKTKVILSVALKFKGKGAQEFGGDKREWDIEGKREKKD
jgi:hypothetical protein